VKTGHPFERQLAYARGERPDQGRARASMDLPDDVGEPAG
jgi:hypothetical protein